MIGGAASLTISPLLPWPALAGLGGLAVLVIAVALARGAAGTGWRVLGAGALLAALLNPSLILEDREALDDVAVVVVDDSPSQAIGARRQRTEAALRYLEKTLVAEPGLSLKVVHTSDMPAAESGAEAGGTRLIGALSRALADVPRQRLAGVVAITDGQVQDAAAATRLDLAAPFHVLLSGQHGEGDRRLVLEEAPRFAIVGRPVELVLRVEDLPAGASGSARVTVRQDGGPPVEHRLPIGEKSIIAVTVERAGPSVLEIEVEPGPNELTSKNNRAVLVINGVRDRLRVLLVSGEPHPGERMWRNLLKSDPAVDLIHFTILRPPDKQDSTPIRELSLITFPTYELFEVKINDFDLIIFDRYRRRGVLALGYFANIAKYVEQGGALLVAAGPNFASPVSIYNTPLGSLLPGEPTGKLLERGFRPALTEAGRRHPVTAELAPATPDGARWGRWFRQIDVIARRGTTLMSGIDDRPLLMLDRIGEGRVALLLSDQLWLWARGYEGGGPQSELLRRLAHWLMKEPELEENALHADSRDGRLAIRRRSSGEAAGPVTVTTPSGKHIRLELVEQAPGRAGAELAAEETGLYRVSDGRLTALAAVGPSSPVELADPRATAAALAPLAARTGGGIVWLADEPRPEMRRVRAGRDSVGRVGAHHWLGLRMNEAYVVRGLRRTPLLPAVLVLVLGLGGLMLAWRREGR